MIEGCGNLPIRMSKQSYVYIITNSYHNVLYTGVTSDLIKRVYQHRIGESVGFTKKYNVKILVYYEVFNDIKEAIAREKQITAKKRRKKVELIESINPSWKDLYEELLP